VKMMPMDIIKKNDKMQKIYFFMLVPPLHIV